MNKSDSMNFSSVLDALKYRQVCPLCFTTLTFDDRDHQVINNDGILTLEINGIDSSISIDLTTQFCVINQTMVANVNKFEYISGYHYFRLSLDCSRCEYYNITFQLIGFVSGSKCNVQNVVLNSETISLEDIDTSYVHEIRNCYTTKKTEYTYYPKVGSAKEDKSYTFPLILLNLEDPYHTLRKIKTLLVFS